MIAQAVQGLSSKPAARVASTGDLGATYDAVGGPSSSGSFAGAPTVVDGETLSDGDRVLVVNQTNPEENGLYVVVNAAAGEWVRDENFDEDGEVDQGALVPVESGVVNGGALFALPDTNATIGTAAADPLNFMALPGRYSADGVTITLTGTQFSLSDNAVTDQKRAVRDDSISPAFDGSTLGPFDLASPIDITRRMPEVNGIPQPDATISADGMQITFTVAFQSTSFFSSRPI